MGAVGEIIGRFVNKKKGMIRQILLFDSKSPSIAVPVSDDINDDGTAEIIAATSRGDIYALREDSSKMWAFRVREQVDEVEAMFLDAESSNSINSSPKVADIDGDGKKDIVFGTEFGKLYALDSSGRMLWSFKTEGAIRGSVCITESDGKKAIVFGSMDGNIYFLDHNGSALKKIRVGVEIESTPLIVGELLVFGASDGFVYAYTSSNSYSSPLWKFKTDAKVTAEPALLADKDGSKSIVIGSTDNNLYCIDMNGKLVWKYETEGSVYSRATIADINDDGSDEILVSSCDNKVHALDRFGHRLWSFETDFWIIGSPVVVDIDGDGKKEVIVGSYDTHIYVLSGEGAFSVEYMPGVAGIVTQEGSYSEIQTQSPGNVVGKRIWLLKTAGIIIGCCIAGRKVIAQTKDGLLLWFEHTDDV